MCVCLRVHVLANGQSIGRRDGNKSNRFRIQPHVQCKSSRTCRTAGTSPPASRKRVAHHRSAAAACTSRTRWIRRGNRTTTEKNGYSMPQQHDDDDNSSITASTPPCFIYLILFYELSPGLHVVAVLLNPLLGHDLLPLVGEDDGADLNQTYQTGWMRDGREDQERTTRKRLTAAKRKKAPLVLAESVTMCSPSPSSREAQRPCW